MSSKEPSFNGEYPCNNYGNRLKDYSFCKPCPDKIVESCSIITLEKHLGKAVDVITTKGNKIKLTEQKEQEHNKIIMFSTAFPHMRQYYCKGCELPLVYDGTSTYNYEIWKCINKNCRLFDKEQYAGWVS